MPSVAYAVHTRTCTYLLDDSGACRFIITPTGFVPEDIRMCIGAQFVACLTNDARLFGELQLGATALLVKRHPKTGKMTLIRTGFIRGIEHTEAAQEALLQATEVFSGEPTMTNHDVLPGFPLPGARRHLAAFEIPEDAETTVTIALPLYRVDPKELARGASGVLPPATPPKRRFPKAVPPPRKRAVEAEVPAKPQKRVRPPPRKRA